MLIWTLCGTEEDVMIREEAEEPMKQDYAPYGLFWELVGMLALMALIFGLPWFFGAFNSAIGR